MIEKHSSGAIGGSEFLEIEFKFLVNDDFQLGQFIQHLQTLKPEKEFTTQVCDTYYLLKSTPRFVYRHRLDNYLQQLTLKSLAEDNEVRTEVNLDLTCTSGSQAGAVLAFLAPLGLLWSGELTKSVWVFLFADVEVVFYRAEYEGKSQACVEIEVSNSRDLESAGKKLCEWSHRLGFNPEDRCKKSILELLVFPSVDPSIVKILQASGR